MATRQDPRRSPSSSSAPRSRATLLSTLIAFLIVDSRTNQHWVRALSEVADEQWGFVEKKGSHFVVNGDQPFFVHGFNTYWLMVFAVDPATRCKVSAVFREATSAGLNVCRTWAFNDGGWRALQVSPLVYDEQVFVGLDFVVSEARRHNMRLILTFCNNWADYGGKAQYVRWGKEAGLDLSSDDDFFSDPTLKSYYKAFVEAVLTRINSFTNVAYKDDPTIIAWELINEPRCCLDPSGDALQAWFEEMVPYVKSIDPTHLLDLGTEGFYGPSTAKKLHLNPNESAGQAGTDFIRNHLIPGVDFASVHVYSDTWLSDSDWDAHLQFVRDWIHEHTDDAEKVLVMPIVFGEFGVSVKDERFNHQFRETFMDTVYNTLLSSREFRDIGGGCLVWQLFPEGTEHMDDGYAVVLARSPSTMQMLAQHSVDLQGLHYKKSMNKEEGSVPESEPHDEL